MRAIVVHHAEHVEAALKAAAEYDVPVTMVSPPAAAGYAGARYATAMLESAAALYPGARWHYILDCGQDAAQVMQALACGHRHISACVPEPAYSRLVALAREYHAILMPYPDDALDLRWMHDLHAAIANWLVA